MRLVFGLVMLGEELVQSRVKNSGLNESWNIPPTNLDVVLS